MLNTTPSLEKLLATQTLARQSVQETIGFIKEGWSEAQAASFLETVLRDHGVQQFFHKPFAWFGERTRFKGISHYWQFQPRKDLYLKSNEVVILDVAPIYDQVSADIGYAFCLEPHAELEKAKQDLKNVRKTILDLFNAHEKPRTIWKKIDQAVIDLGYENIHKKYPLQVLGHRLYNHPQKSTSISFLNFGLEAYRSLLSKGVLSEVITPLSTPSLEGVWAIEPHLGAKNFGAKFEEVLVVTKEKSFWLDQEFI
jgi:Xaa-Pro aminopeptidase